MEMTSAIFLRTLLPSTDQTETVLQSNENESQIGSSMFPIEKQKITSEETQRRQKPNKR